MTRPAPPPLAFEPPDGVDDLRAHADGGPVTLDVAGEPVTVTIPAAAALPLLYDAVQGERRASNADRRDAAVRFLAHHVDPEDWAHLLARMVDPEDTVGDDDLAALLRGTVTAGTGRPFRAVASLTVAAARHWRTLRGRLALAGVTDPLRQLPDLHALLDAVEALLLEHADADAVNKHMTALYRPDPSEKPRNFTADDQLDAFAAFEAAAAAEGLT